MKTAECILCLANGTVSDDVFLDFIGGVFHFLFFNLLIKILFKKIKKKISKKNNRASYCLKF